MAFLFTGLLIWYLYDQGWRTPLESKIVKECHLKKRPLEILEHDDGYFLFKQVTEEGPEGFVHTKPEGKQRMFWTGFFARPSSNSAEMLYPENASEEQKKEVDVTNRLAKELGMWASEKRYLKGARIPCSVGYIGKAVLTTVKAVAALQLLEKLDLEGPQPESPA